MENFVFYLESLVLEKRGFDPHFFPTYNEMDWIQEMKLCKLVW